MLTTRRQFLSTAAKAVGGLLLGYNALALGLLAYRRAHVLHERATLTDDLDLSMVPLPPHLAAHPGTDLLYRNVLKHHAAFGVIPCYCLCFYLGHTDLRSCYIRSVEHGQVQFSDHGINCGVCTSENLIITELLEAGMPVAEIREQIIAQFSKYGMGSVGPGEVGRELLRWAKSGFPSLTLNLANFGMSPFAGGDHH